MEKTEQEVLEDLLVLKENKEFKVKEELLDQEDLPELLVLMEKMVLVEPEGSLEPLEKTEKMVQEVSEDILVLKV